MTFEELNKLKNPEILEIIKQNEKESPDSFVLKNSSKKELPLRAIAEQISCRKKACKKLPEISKTDFLYNSVSLEQCSGEAAAKYKTKLLSGENLLDMTGGLGIDDLYFSKVFLNVEYCEISEVLSELMLFNLASLGITNINVHNGDSTDLLQKFPDNSFDWIYIDPARRAENRRSVDITFCTPNILEIYEELFKKASKVCVKLSPAFDLKEAVRIFPNLSSFVVVSVDGECKEVLLLLNRNNVDDILVRSVVLSSNTDFEFTLEKNLKKICDKIVAEDISGWFFEPDPAIIKAGLSSKLAVDVGLNFVNLNVDYLTGKTKIDNFPGRVFSVKYSSAYKPNEFKSYLKQNKVKKANFAKRDFPLTVEELRKKFKISEGGSDYFFFTKDKNENLIYIHAIR